MFAVQYPVNKSLGNMPLQISQRAPMLQNGIYQLSLHYYQQPHGGSWASNSAFKLVWPRIRNIYISNCISAPFLLLIHFQCYLQTSICPLPLVSSCNSAISKACQLWSHHAHLPLRPHCPPPFMSPYHVLILSGVPALSSTTPLLKKLEVIHYSSSKKLHFCCY